MSMTSRKNKMNGTSSSSVSSTKSSLDLLSAFQPKVRYSRSTFSIHTSPGGMVGGTILSPGSYHSHGSVGSIRKGHKSHKKQQQQQQQQKQSQSAPWNSASSTNFSSSKKTGSASSDDSQPFEGTFSLNSKSADFERKRILPRPSGILPGLKFETDALTSRRFGMDSDDSDVDGGNHNGGRTKARYHNFHHPHGSKSQRGKIRKMRLRNKTRIFDDPAVIAGYASVPLMEIDNLPRGGISIDTQGVGRIQFGIPPETIKDSMKLGFDVPEFYIVPVERFCREMGPALGINLAEFEFPGYFNYFVRGRKVTLVVDSEDTEKNIRSVFNETLLGPSQFRDHDYPKPNEEEDFDPSYDENERPNFYREFFHFRTAEKSNNYQELNVDTLITFRHFQVNTEEAEDEKIKLGEPPTIKEDVDNTRDYKSDEELFGKTVRISVTADADQPKSPLKSPSNKKAAFSSDSNTKTIASGSTKTSKNAKGSLPKLAFSQDELGTGTEHTLRSTFGRRRSSTTEISALSLAGLDEGVVVTDYSPSHHHHLSSNPSSTTTNSGGGTSTFRRSSLKRRGSHPESRGVVRRVSIGAGSGGGGSNANFRRLSIASRRSSADTITSRRGSTASRRASTESSSVHSSGHSSYDQSFGETSSMVGDDGTHKTSWMYSQVKWLGEVATVYPPHATEEEKENYKCSRVEIFKMPGGSEYVVHDIDENNTIIGKCRFSGTVRVPDEYAVEGFLAPEVAETVATGFKTSVDESLHDDDDDDDDDNATDEESGRIIVDTDDDEDGPPSDGTVESSSQKKQNGGVFKTGSVDPLIPLSVIPPTFHPPSFGVTVLGNSHGFDKNGSTSGYVLWINGRGVMIDPPPYASATLEREGIRPQMIMAIIITHCHADHDAGAFQKVLTGSKVAVITTPTIYKSFIRKYAALSGLSPALLRHSHRHRPAIIGQPLKFQGAKFYFRYTLHTIPCIAFKVEWRKKSMVFTGDHLNLPPMIQTLQDKGVLTKERADSLRYIPFIPCDVLLHEAGAPPIHTPLAVLKELPVEIKARLYVVHTSALPEDSGLRVAPTGTKGTLRLDCLESSSGSQNKNNNGKGPPMNQILAIQGDESSIRNNGSDDGIQSPAPPPPPTPPPRRAVSESMISSNFDKAGLDDRYYPHPSALKEYQSITNFAGTGEDRKFQLNIPTTPQVFTRPTCVSDAWFILNLLSNIPFFSSLSYVYTMEVLEIAMVELYYPNEVVIPAQKRPEILCVVWEGTCVERKIASDVSNSNNNSLALNSLLPPETIIEESSLAENSSSSQRLSSHQRHSIEPKHFHHHHHHRHHHIPHDSLSGVSLDSDDSYDSPAVWHAGDWTGPVSLQPDVERSAESSTPDNLKDIVGLSSEGVKVIILQMKDLRRILKRGSKLFRKYLSLQERQQEQEAAFRNDGMADDDASRSGMDTLLEVIKYNSSLGRLNALQKRHIESIAEGPRLFQEGAFLWKVGESVEYAFLIVQGNAAFGHTGKSFDDDEHSFYMGRQEEDKLLTVQPNSEYAKLELSLQVRMDRIDRGVYDHPRDLLPKEEAALLSRDRFANKVLQRLYARRAYTAGLIFSRGHFLSDIGRMVSGDLSAAASTLPGEGAFHRGHCHSSNMVAGRGGCVVMVFQRSSLVPFLEANPGVLLTVLGTHVVV